jgi:hypothetical protein
VCRQTARGSGAGFDLCGRDVPEAERNYLLELVADQFSRSTHPFPETEEGANECERNGDTKPQSKDSNQGGEGHSSRATFAPQDQVEHEEQREYNTKTEIKKILVW